jgi:hypothetical protein
VRANTLERGICTGISVDASGFISLQTSAYGERPGGTHAEALLPYGLVGVPYAPELDANGDPDPARAVQVLKLWDSEDDHLVLPYTDVRGVDKLPRFGPKGATGLQFPPTGAFAVFAGENGSFYLSVPYGTAAAPKTATVEVDVEDKTKPSFTVLVEDMSIVAIDGTMTLRAGDHWISIDKTQGVTVNGTLKVVGGTSTGGPAEALPLALAPALLAWVTAVADLLGKIAATPAAPGSPPSANPLVAAGLLLTSVVPDFVAKRSTGA